MFQSYAWNWAAACMFRERETPHVVYTESDSGAALIPAAVKDGRLRMIGEAMFDYRDVLIDGDVSVLGTAWAQAAELGLDFETGALRADGNAAAWDCFERSSFYGAPFVSHRQVNSAEFVSEHNRLGRWVRRFEREGVALRCHTGDNSALVRQIYERKANPGNGDSLFVDPLRVEFMVQVCEAVGSACEIFTYETTGTLVASLVTFLDRNVRRFYTVQFEPAWAKYSPGTVLIYEITRRSLEAGLDCDYMTGEHPYKMRFATSVIPMHWVQASQQMLASMPRGQALAA